MELTQETHCRHSGINGSAALCFKNGRALITNSVQALHRQKKHLAHGVRNYSMTFKKLQPCMDKLASPFCTGFYIEGLNTHKDTNDSQIKIDSKMSLF